MLKNYIAQGLRFLLNPEKSLNDLKMYSLEYAAGYYMILLISTSIAAGIFNFLFSFIKTVYLDFFVNADVNYLGTLNYLLSTSVAFTFLYLIIGTFVLMLISVLFKLFLPRIKYASLLRIMLFSSTPLLLFGWIPLSAVPLIVWSLFLFVNAVRLHKNTEINKGSIQHRY